MNYLAHGADGDRQKALELLNLALQDAQRLKLPEARQIADIIRQAENPPEPIQRGGLLARAWEWIRRRIG